ncbi:hypothetical protein [Streptomyces asiaticus]
MAFEAEAAWATAFWSAALGGTAEPFPPEPQFTTLHEVLPGLVTAVQAVDDAPRIHLDIEKATPKPFGPRPTSGPVIAALRAEGLIEVIHSKGS